ncbi:hypothetical protein NS303_15985 [Pantoea ananatis]|uniref:hypothetical protein n=1 Tax=Pantoea ananas TaxID=553 RepID=UPI0007366C95|nr:hypothetical protein [Pantoea ananatis]KTR47282.1 hypothetical protein NS303_15985 [Pantoea ananatis]KTR56403.1 hypothetical protein NS311_07790 [Pantoea ananatis]KTR62949.1 hypothetical protein RSA47_19710 [Pantoea ananatis]KTR72905.1 hypothetical protein NS296_00090 [Pantoea ananatis]
MNNLPVINFSILSVEYIHEISLSETPPSEIRITFSCLSPVNETDTFATVNHYFDGGIDFSCATVTSETGYIYMGSLKMCNRDSIENITAGEFTIPLSAVLATLLKNGTYLQQCDPYAIMADAWFGDRCKTVKASWLFS